MITHSKAPTADPTTLIEIRDSIYAADLMVTAITHLNLFDEISKATGDLDAICRRFELDRRCADVMLTYFVSIELLRLKNAKYAVTDLAHEFLTADSQWNLSTYFATQSERPIVNKMLDALKTGTPQSWGAKKDAADWATAMADANFANKFAAGMDSRGAVFAPGIAATFDFSTHKSILDIGGASGIYVATIINKFPHLKGGVLEKHPVSQTAALSIKQKGMSDAIEIIEGDMFASIPSGFDVHLYSHVLHDWNEQHNRILIQNSYNALPDGGTLIIHDAHLNADKTGPRSVAEYSVLLMFSTAGRCYSVAEIENMMRGAGFTDIEANHTAGNRSIVTGRKR